MTRQTVAPPCPACGGQRWIVPTAVEIEVVVAENRIVDVDVTEASPMRSEGNIRCAQCGESLLDWGRGDLSEEAWADYHDDRRQAWDLLQQLTALMQLPVVTDWSGPAKLRTCRVCGCTDDWGCDEGCSWVEEDLCSLCVAAEVSQSHASMTRRVHVFTDPISAAEVSLSFVGLGPWSLFDGSAGIVHPGCGRMADVSPDLDAFYCRECGQNGRVSGAWVLDVLHSLNAG